MTIEGPAGCHWAACAGSVVIEIQPKRLQELLKRKMVRQPSKSEVLLSYSKVMAVV